MYPAGRHDDGGDFNFNLDGFKKYSNPGILLDFPWILDSVD